MPTGIEAGTLRGLTQSDASGALPLIAHVLYRLDVGGLENGLVNLINQLPENRYRHAIICLSDYTEFAHRIQRPDVALYALHKPPGNSLRMHGQIWQLFRELRPAIVHTRNLGAIEAQVAAYFARVPVRIHSEHGRDVDDLDGSSRKNQWLRRFFSPFVHQYIALSQDLADYLTGAVGIGAAREIAPCCVDHAEEIGVAILRLDFRALRQVMVSRNAQHVVEAGHDDDKAELGQQRGIGLIVARQSGRMMQHHDAGVTSPRMRFCDPARDSVLLR